MSEDQEKKKGNRPTHRAYKVENGDWKPKGAMWMYKSGKGFRLKLDSGESYELVWIDWKKRDAGEPEPPLSRPADDFGEPESY